MDTYFKIVTNFFLSEHVCGKVSTQNKKMSWIFKKKIKMELNDTSRNLITNLVLN